MKSVEQAKSAPWINPAEVRDDVHHPDRNPGPASLKILILRIVGYWFSLGYRNRGSQA